MNQEIKDKLEQAAKAYFSGDGSDELSPFKAGAQTILDNPQELGLMSINQHIKEMGHEAMAQDLMREDIEKFKAQNERYREALERIANEDDEPLSDIGIVEAKWIAKEALKQEANND